MHVFTHDDLAAGEDRWDDELRGLLPMSKRVAGRHLTLFRANGVDNISVFS
jgi:hypothetical protein